ncbi:MAG: serine/threonine-protein kinase [Phycisphaerae bacterium]|nr:serine/threonine-protein kinase [Phycisphaerae bacterium]
MAYTFKYGDRPIDGLTVQRAVGRGGFGEVYYALSDSGKQLAVKYLRDNPEVELRGISHVMNLKSPHLITIYDVKKDTHGDSWVLMEYVGGPSLRDILNAEPRGLGLAKAAFFLKGIGAGLAYLHERGIVHRDLKPGNIFYDDGYVKIGDYGLSKHISVSKHSGNTMSVGTVHYMAPEIGSGSYTRAIDIYALGVMLYEMLTGQLPFSGSSMGEILMRHLSERPDVSSVPEPFRSVISRALAKKPEDRFQDVNEMVDLIVGASDVSADMSSFDPNTLSQVPRSEAPAVGSDLTRTAGQGAGFAGRAPILDVRDPLPPLPGGGVPVLPPKLERKVDRLKRRLDQKLEKMDRKRGVKRETPRAAMQAMDAAASKRGRWGQWFALALVTFAAAPLLSLAAPGSGGHKENAIPVAMLMLMGGTAGALLSYFKFIDREDGESSFFNRLVLASVATLFMAPAMAPGEDLLHQQPYRLLIGPAAAFLLCNWVERIDKGRAGMISAGPMFIPALIGFIAAHIADVDDFAWMIAGVNAVLAVLIPAGAALWLHEPRGAAYAGSAGTAVPPPPMQSPGYGGAMLAANGAQATAAATAAAHEAVLRGQAMPQAAPPMPVNYAPPVAPVPSAGTPVRGEYERPNFFVRTFNGMLGMFGTLLLLVGVAWAGAYYNVEPQQVDDGKVTISARSFSVNSPHESVNVRWPAATVFAPGVIGGLLLLVSRRSDGGGHFFRGLLGVGATLGLYGVLLGSAGSVIARLLSDEIAFKALNGDDKGAVVSAIGMAFAAFTFLLWPKRRRVVVAK